MLVLSRKIQETICIGAEITITVTDIGQGRVKIGIDAPNSIPIARGELEPKDRSHVAGKSQAARRPRH